MLYSPEIHELLVDEPWDPETVHAAIRTIARDCDEAFDGECFWPFHPRDADGDDDEETKFTTVYLGSAGVIDALVLLQQRGLVDEPRDYRPVLERAIELYDATTEFGEWAHPASFWMGKTGILVSLYRLAPGEELAGRIADLIQANAGDAHREFMWGSPGTMLAARAIGRDDLWRASAASLRADWEDSGLWSQHLYGSVDRYIGPAHGFAGCVAALSHEPDEELHRRASEACRQNAIEEDGLVNWPPNAGGQLVHHRDGTIRTQWCHGAPGVVAYLADIAPGDDEHERLLLAGGELVWRAGPLAKGANLCHGTAGNGLAFLKLFARTGDELWLERARAFAMHAAAQVERERRHVGRGRYTLWTGDPGTALYLALCLEGGSRLPGFDEPGWA